MSKQPVSFYEAFKQVVLYRTGLTVSETELHKELLEHELELALRLSGLAGDGEQVEEPGIAESGRGKEGRREGEKDKEAKEPKEPKKESKGKGKGEGKGEKEEKSTEPTWSGDAERLLRLVKRLGPRNPNLCSSAFLKPFFRDLRLPQLHVASFSEAVLGFSQLTSLDVSRNCLTDIAYLPPNLQFLRAYNNKLSRLSCKPLPSLCFLGVGFNPLGDGLDVGKFPNLLSLDAGNTDVADLPSALAKLKMAKLRHLYLLGSPACLLPFYRLQLLRDLPQLEALDGLAPSEEELAEAQLPLLEEDAEATEPTEPAEPTEPTEQSDPRAKAAKVGGGADWCRLSLAFGQLQNHKELLREALLLPSDEEAFAASQAAAAAAGEEVVERDALSEKCGQDGQVRLTFQLPSGVWVATSSINLAKKTHEVEEGQPPPPVVLKDSLKLKALRQENNQHLHFELGFGVDDGLEGLRSLRQWLHRGLQIKLWYVPKAPVKVEEEEEAGSGAADVTEAATDVAEAAGEVPATPEPAKAEAATAEHVCLGGCVVPLASFLQRAASSVAGASNKTCPEPWQHAAEASAVSMAQWLNPEIQVPILKEKDKEKEKPRSAALLDLVITLYALPLEDVAESEEEAPPPAPKAKAKAKGKK